MVTWRIVRVNIKAWKAEGVEVPPPNARVLRVLISPEATGHKHLTLLTSTLHPRSSTGKHTHDVDEFMYVVTGRGESTTGDESELIEPDTLVVAPANVTHEIRNTGDESLNLFCVFAPPLKPSGYIAKAVEAAKKHETRRERSAGSLLGCGMFRQS